MSTKKLFISQPMNGLSDEDIKKERDRIVGHIKELINRETNEPLIPADTEIELIDSFFEGAPHDAKPLWFLGESFKKLSEADIVYFGAGWQDARGCKMEREAAAKYLSDVLIIEE